MSYIGSTPTTQSFISGTDYFNGTGSQTAFTLSRNVASVNDVEAVVNNVVQRPNDAYTISGTTITFTSAPSAGTSNIYVRYLSTTTQSITPSQNTVSYSTLNTDMQSGGYASNFKNRLINGNMTIDQRNAGASVTPASGTYNNYCVDRFPFSTDGGGGRITAQQSSTVPAGFSNSLSLTVQTVDSSIGSGDQYWLEQRIEGNNVADMGFGTANASTFTLSFWVRSSVTGTYSISLRSTVGSARSYVATYVINAANTWEQKTITVAGDTSGTWVTTNSTGLQVLWDLGSGSNFQGTAGSWQTANLYRTSGSVNWISNSGATFFLTGVQLEKGSTATSFDYRPYGTELALCQRYYQEFGNGVNNFSMGMALNDSANGIRYGWLYLPIVVAFRVVPTITGSGLNSTSFTLGGLSMASNGNINLGAIQVGVTGGSNTGQSVIQGTKVTMSAEL